MPTIQGDGDTEKETNVGIQTSRKLVDNMLCKQYPIVFVFNPRGSTNADYIAPTTSPLNSEHPAAPHRGEHITLHDSNFIAVWLACA